MDELTPKQKKQKYYREHRDECLQRVKAYQEKHNPKIKQRKQKTSVAFLMKLKLEPISESLNEKPNTFFTVSETDWK